jgi:hypothetical protein
VLADEALRMRGPVVTVTLPETIEHLDFDHEPGCGCVFGGVQCGMAPVTAVGRVDCAASCEPPLVILLCSGHEESSRQWLADMAAIGWDTACRACGAQATITVVPL